MPRMFWVYVGISVFLVVFGVLLISSNPKQNALEFHITDSSVHGVRLYAITDTEVEQRALWFEVENEVIMVDNLGVEKALTARYTPEAKKFVAIAGFIKTDVPNVLGHDPIPGKPVWMAFEPDSRMMPAKSYGFITYKNWNCAISQFDYDDGGISYTSDWDRAGLHIAWVCTPPTQS